MADDNGAKKHGDKESARAWEAAFTQRFRAIYKKSWKTLYMREKRPALSAPDAQLTGRVPIPD
ncbi:Hypothetical predicted protein, partial [Pelobates cultripes]